MRSVFALVIVPLSLSSLACSLLHRPGATDAGVTDAGASATDAATSGGPPPAADNVNEVARFPDEANLNDTSAKVADPKGIARNSVPSGALVATLPIGTAVTEIASHDNFILCSFTDPKNSSRTLEGWVAAAAFVAGPTPAPTHGCGAGQVMLTYDEQDWCGRVCKTDKDCATGQSCSGKANLFVNGKAGAETETCTIPAPGTVPVAPSAGGTIVGVQQPPLAGGKCADKYVMASDKMCHFDCSKSPLQCPPKSRCTATLTNPKQPVCEESH